jgi:2-C-methyl-D-erythritol 2,4-cyclodiphosphate synthase
VHAFVKGRRLVLGGVEIAHSQGLKGHSDADVLLHAITDALLGALALGDIGSHFPDNDERFRNADSRKLLRSVYDLVLQRGYRLGNVDSTVVAQQPKLAPYIARMREVIAQELEAAPDSVSVKATTSEKLGFEGREEGISAHAVVLIVKS